MSQIIRPKAGWLARLHWIRPDTADLAHLTVVVADELDRCWGRHVRR